MSESEVGVQHSVPASEPSQWADVFYGLLVVPIQTIEFLTHDESFCAKPINLIGAAFTVILANGINAIVDAGASGNKPTAAIILGAEFQALVMWLALSAILHIVAGWIARREVDFNVSLVSVGWAFLPLIFTAPMSCFASLGIIYNLLAAIPIFWTCILQWLVLSHSLKIGSVRMFALLVLAPPIFIVAYLFWLSVAFAGVARFFLA